nr:MAG TPA: hypothetical protein [Caudoviricetes sp.]
MAISRRWSFDQTFDFARSKPKKRRDAIGQGAEPKLPK